MNRLRELREGAAMKQADLARQLSVGQQTISKYEAGRLDIDTSTIARLCDLFGCTADYLLGLSSVRTPELTEEEYALVAGYRAADARARDMVNLALAPFRGEATPKEDTA